MKVLPATAKMALLHMVGSFPTLTADAYILVSTTLALYDSCLWIEPMVTNIDISHLPTSPLRVHPDSFTLHSTRLRTLGNFPGHGSLTPIDSSC